MNATTGLPLFQTKKPPQWRKVYEYLKSHGGQAFTMEIIHGCGVTAVSQRMQDMEKQGYPYSCEQVGVSENGAKLCLYKLLTP